MSSLQLFCYSILALAIIWTAVSFARAGVNPLEYAKTRAGKGVLKGILLALLFTLGVAGSSLVFAGQWFSEASVYAGLDYTKTLSPMCEDTGPDNRTTSNLGLRLRAYESNDKRFRVNSKYTHHSCAFSPDNKSYDALGVELEYVIWTR